MHIHAAPGIDLGVQDPERLGYLGRMRRQKVGQVHMAKIEAKSILRKTARLTTVIPYSDLAAKLRKAFES